jgi:3'(2'), 5'-bisphosphate nucleotidase
MTFRASDYFRIASTAQGRAISQMDYMAPLVLAAGFAHTAGGILLNHYGKKIAVTLKDSDNSPVTTADYESSDFLVSRLGTISRAIPVVSEENTEPGGQTYWAVDPLDGTREFIDQTGGFCVKIGLIHKFEPVAGIVFCPAQNVLYAALKDGPAVKITPDGVMSRITTRSVMESGVLKTLFNKKHGDPAEYRIRRAELAAQGLRLPTRPLVRAGLPRNLRVAEGLADAHLGCGFGAGPAAGSGYVWDVAPDDVILRRAGGRITHYDGSSLRFDTPRERMPGYIALGDAALVRKLTRTTLAP